VLPILPFLVAVAVLATFHASLFHPAFDTFHEGEFFAHAWIAHLRADGRFPMLIHGGMDHIPGRIVEAVCDADARIACIRFANTALVALATLLFLICCHGLASLPTENGGRLTRIALMLPGLAFVLLHNGHAVDSVGVQQGAPGIRDLVLLLVILLVVTWCKALDEDGADARRASLSLPAAFGFVASLGCFWAYNRGLIAIVLVAALATAASLGRRDVRILLAGAAGATAGASVAAISGVYGDSWGNVQSIQYWMRNGDIWRLPRTLPYLLVPAPGLIVMLATVATAVIMAWRRWKRGEHGRTLLLLALCMACLGYAVQTASRPDRPHVAWALWPVVLLMTLVLREAVRSPRIPFRRAALCGFAGTVVIAVAAFYAPSRPGADVLRLVHGTGVNLVALTQPLPRDRDLAHPGLRDAADAIRARAQTCTYALTNEGLLYPLARTPPCSRFALPSFVANAMEESVIAELEAAAPEALLYDSPNYAARIDGRSLADRTPRIARWVTENYPHREEFEGGYVLALRRPAAR
jgi:hypothetical protein